MVDDINYIATEFIQDNIDNDINMLQAETNLEINHNKSEDFIILSRDNSCKMSDTISEKTCSSLGNDLEAILSDHTAIIKCLITAPYQRSKSQIRILTQLLQSIPDFFCINGTDWEYLCQSAQLRIIAQAEEIIVKKCSKLSEWYLCLEGTLRREDCVTTLLGPGRFIGTDLFSGETLISDYDLYSNCDDCKLLVIVSDDLKPRHESNKTILKTSDEDKTVIAVYEPFIKVADTDDMCGYVLTKGTQDVLIAHLFSNPMWTSKDFVEDFFLTHKVFLNTTTNIMNEISTPLFLDDECAKERFDVLLRWISQSFTAFEKDLNKMSFLENIISILKNQNNTHWLYVLYECCSNSARVRDVIETISLKDFVIGVQVSEHHSVFYIHKINDVHCNLRDGDVILELEGLSSEAITMDVIKSLGEEHRPLSMSLRSDLLGYHEQVLKDISIDSMSVHSTPSNTHYSHCSSDKMSDAISISTNDSDYNATPNSDINLTFISDKTNYVTKRPSILPGFFSNLNTGTVGRFFKNPKHYVKTVIPSTSRSNSDVTTRADCLPNGTRDLVGSSFSISRFSRRMKSKRQRRSVGSNSDLIKSFDDLEVIDNSSIHNTKTPIRIYLKDAFISYVCHSSPKSDLRFLHILVQPFTTVTEVIVRTLLKLSLSSTSTSSNEFYLVEVKVNESNGMIHEKILHPNTSNLVGRMKEHCRFYLKHRSFVGESLVLQSEADKMREEFKFPSLLQMSISGLVCKLFVRSYRQLCQIQPDEIMLHVTNNKTTLKYNKGSTRSSSGILEYMHLSDFYKYWVMTEICSEESASTRALIIQFFIRLALKAVYIGHIDLFFSIISGIESVEVTKLSISWEKVSKRDKMLLENLKTTLDVSGNMRNLRIIHQKMESPLIPVTAMTIKDMTMLEETQSTYMSGTIDGIQVNRKLINFEKLSKMSRLARIFVNSVCSCCEDKSRPVIKHMAYCKIKLENQESLERLLKRRLENHSDNKFQKIYSDSVNEKSSRKYSMSNISVQSSSTESLSDSATLSEEKSNCRAYDQLMMTMKIERYLTKLSDRVIVDPTRLFQMSSACEQNNVTDERGKVSKTSSALPPLNSEVEMEHISEKAAEILGLIEKSKIHKYKRKLP